MKQIKIIAIAIGSIMLLGSCKKETKESPLVTEKTKLLTEKAWIVEKIEERIGGGTWEDLFPFFENCVKDNQFKFNTNSTVSYNEGSNACPPNTPNQIIETKTWKLTNNEALIIIGSAENKILQLDKDNLIVIETEIMAEIGNIGSTLETRTTFRH
jgi:hypothetical protein